jgi:hypothetical protein
VKLVGQVLIPVSDVTYPIRPWMFPPYKGHKNGLNQKNIIGILSKV